MADADVLMAREAITGVVLAGGLGRRMGGVDKGLQQFRGQMLAAHVAQRLAPQVDHLLFNANRNPEAYAALGYPVIADDIPDFAGPLAGLQAALTASADPLVATAPCDSPFLPADLVFRLFSGLTATNADVAVVRAEQRLHPVFCLCRRDLLPALTAFLTQGGRRVQDWLATQRTTEVAFDDCPEAFANFNTLEQLDIPS
jgi:molybdopterin-guanine dinucleotide biosynthesis protein A